MYLVSGYASLLGGGPDVRCACGDPHWTSKVASICHAHFPWTRNSLVLESDSRVFLDADLPLRFSHSICGPLLFESIPLTEKSRLPLLRGICSCNIQRGHIASMMGANGINQPKHTTLSVSVPSEGRERGTQVRHREACWPGPCVGVSYVSGGQGGGGESNASDEETVTTLRRRRRPT